MDCWTRTIKSQKGQGKKAIRMMGREREIRDKTKEKRDQRPRKAKQNEANKETSNSGEENESKTEKENEIRSADPNDVKRRKQTTEAEVKQQQCTIPVLLLRLRVHILCSYSIFLLFWCSPTVDPRMKQPRSSSDLLEIHPVAPECYSEVLPEDASFLPRRLRGGDNLIDHCVYTEFCLSCTKLAVVHPAPDLPVRNQSAPTSGRSSQGNSPIHRHSCHSTPPLSFAS